MNFRKGNIKDLEQLRVLGLKSWAQFKNDLRNEFWDELFEVISNSQTYSDLLLKSECIVCESNSKEIIGMAFLVPKGNPNDTYDEHCCQLRFVSVSPEYRGKNIGKILTEMCIQLALQNKEEIMALHTSEIMQTAIRIYEKLGFTILRELEPRLGVRYWLYTLDLNASDSLLADEKAN